MKKFETIRDKLSSPECQRLLSELNMINVELEESRYAVNLLEMRYAIKMAEYRTFLGFEVSADEKVKLEEYQRELDAIGEEDETV